MSDRAPVQTFQRNDSRGSYLVIGRGETRDDLQINGEWIASDEPAEVRR